MTPQELDARLAELRAVDAQRLAAERAERFSRRRRLRLHEHAALLDAQGHRQSAAAARSWSRALRGEWSW